MWYNNNNNNNNEVNMHDVKEKIKKERRKHMGIFGIK